MAVGNETKSTRVGTVHGRDRELAQLVDGVESALGGGGELFLVAGEAGIGKTRLVEELARIATAKGATVAVGRCWEAVDAPPFWPWTQVLRHLKSDLEDDPGDVPSHRSNDLMELLPGSLGAGGTSSETPGHDRFRLFDSIAALLDRAAASRPLVLVLEDLHAADESSLLLLQFVGVHYRPPRALIVGTYDDLEVRTRPAHNRLLSDLARAGHVIALSPLDEDAVKGIYQDLVDTAVSDAVAKAIHHASEGNPLFVVETVRMLTAKRELHRPDHSTGFRVPEGARAAIRRRLDLLPPPVVELLSVASAFGRDFEVTDLAELSGIERNRVLELLSSAAAAGVIFESSSLGEYSFSHILIRETLYEDLTPGERMRLHLQVARMLEKAYSEDPSPRLTQLAHHWFKAAQAGDPDKTLRYTLKAADAAMAQDAYEEAGRLYHRALKVAEVSRANAKRMAEIRDALRRAQKTSIPMPAETRPASRGKFIRRGDFWTIDFDGRALQLKDAKGLRYMSVLLQNAGREIHVLELVRAVEGHAGGIPAASAADVARSGHAGFGDAGTLLDSKARADYRRRLEDLQRELEEAEAFNDAERAARYREEMDALVEQLAAGVGLGGRDRRAASQAERARVSVTKALKESLRKIAISEPLLGGHLRSAVRTGTYCIYDPDPHAPVVWETS